MTEKDESLAAAEPARERNATDCGIDMQALGHAIDAQRRRMFQALAIIQVVARFLTEDSNAGSDDPDCSDALTAASDLLADVIDQLEPLRLGLGIPRP